MKPSSRMRTPAKMPQKTPQRSRPNSNSQKDSVQVFCRIRPMGSENEESCVKVISSTTVVLTPPEIATNYKLACLRETHYIFKNVFDTDTRQREVYATVAQPLVESLIRGKNGLLFTYGVTGSGKTFTMTGNVNDQGIMPRCLDVLFKTISDYQTKKYIFKPDRLNGFEILSEADAMLERQAEMNSRFGKCRRVDSDPEIASRASKDPSAVDGINEDNMYAVFVTYIEVYNNSVYDLLEDTPVQRTLQSKIIREDATRNMYVHMATEIEVKSFQEAMEAFQRGQKRKRMGHTILNAESSRSHSVFTIRLVQAPTDSQGEYILQDRRTITVSQLSLVDLAGSERTQRTNNTGQRLREAGNINNSLMTLRTCLEILRENQLSGTTKKVPYRDSKLSHLFKNYFEGEGTVKMIVCINPRSDDYDETVQVMKFAEMTQEVQVQRATPVRQDLGLTPGRRKANQLFKIAVNNLEEMGKPEARNLDVDIGLVYSLGPKFPEYRINSPESEETISQLIKFLEQRINKRQALLNDYNSKADSFRMHLVQLERDAFNLKGENASLTAMLNNERQKLSAYEHKMAEYEDKIAEMNRQLKNRDSIIHDMRGQLNQKQQIICQKEMEKEKQKRKFDTRFASETDKLTKEMENKLKEQKNKMKGELRDKENRLKLVADVLSSDYVPDKCGSFKPNIYKRSNSQEETTNTTTTVNFVRSQTPRAPRGVAAANSRHRRSRSAGDRWLEHRSVNPVPLGTILQPYYKSRKSITKLTDIRDVTDSKTSKYCLVSQGADTDGEVETRLYKGNVIPTCGGGAQVIFDDVECLKQRSPSRSPVRKRQSKGECFSPVKDVELNYNIGLGSVKKSKH